MYNQIYEIVKELEVSVKKEEPVLINRKGGAVTEADIIECKVAHGLIRPDMCIVMEEVGGNTSKKRWK